MPRSIEEIVALQAQRELAQGPLLAECREVGTAFEGKLVVPLPELDRDERAGVPNLILQGMTAKAQRISANLPGIEYPVVRLGIKASEEASRMRRRANLGWWEFNTMETKLAWRARHLLGYTTSPVKISPNFKLGIPNWGVADPLGTFPAPPSGIDDMMRRDVILAYASTLAQVKADYPGRMGWMFGALGDERVRMLEYIDDAERVLIATGVSDASTDHAAAVPGSLVLNMMGSAPGPAFAGRDNRRPYEFIVELDRQPNRAGVCWLVVPGTIGLAKPVNRYAAMIGPYLSSAKLHALETIGIQNGILPKTYFVQTEQLGGIVTEATVGHLGHVKGGKLDTLRVEPSLRPDQAIDRYERTQRIEGGIPAATSGEAQTGVRTGRLGDSLLSEAIDPDIAEAHRLLQRSLQFENEVAVAVAKGYAPNRPVSFHVNWKGAKGPVTYTAGDLFADGYAPSVVKYPIVGGDEQALIVGGGQRLGLGVMSKLEFMRLDPMNGDPEFSHDQMVAEGLESALLQGIQQRAASDPAFADSVARMMIAVRSDRKDLAEAYMDEGRRVQEQQASSAAPGEPTGPVEAGTPEAQPGLGVPGGSAMVGTPIQPQGPSEQNLMDLLRTARTVRSQQRAS